MELYIVGLHTQLENYRKKRVDLHMKFITVIGEIKNELD